MKRTRVFSLALLATCALACGPAVSPSAPTSPVSRGGATSAFPAEFEGYYYDGDWGTIVIKAIGGDRVRAAYVHDEGTIEGRWVGGKLVGWWCEVPGRRPNADAGDVELSFIKDGNGSRIDGRWRYGDASNEPGWREDWDVSRTTPRAAPAELLARFNDESAFCRKPGN